MNFDKDEMAEVVQDVIDAPNVKWSWDFPNGKEQWLGTGTFTTLYFPPIDKASSLQQAHHVVDAIAAFNTLIGGKFAIAEHPESSKAHAYSSPRLPSNWYDYTVKYFNHGKNNINYGFSSEKSASDSPEFAVDSNIRFKESTEDYNYIRFDYTLTWWRANRGEFLSLIHALAVQLGAAQGYSGIGFARPLDLGASGDVEGLEYQLAQHFYGLDVDIPFWNSSQSSGLQSLPLGGFRPPVWGLLIGGAWLDALGGATTLIGALRHPDYPQVRCHSISEQQVWLEIDTEPKLYPVTEPAPAAAVFVAKVLQPILGQSLRLIGMGRWEDDNDLGFTPAQSRRWLTRFNAGSQWGVHVVGASDATATPAPRADVPRAEPASICTLAGTWYAIHDRMREITLKVGDTFPAQKDGPTGGITWYWKHG
jgi:Protein of unknown function (DUF3396)